MKKPLVLLCSFLICIISFSQGKKEIAIIPEPVNIVENTGEFLLPQNISIDAGTQPELKQTIAFLQERLAVPTGYQVSTSNDASNATIRLVLNNTADNEIGNEGYRLSVTPKDITIKANQPAGLFYGMQTLVQLFPKEIEGKELMKKINEKCYLECTLR